jgi:UDP-N-acetylglucosamine transferase subunit ALG13
MTTLFLATTGGHLTQLVSLAERIAHDSDSLWVTHANAQSESLLSGSDVYYVPYIGVKDVRGVLKCLPTARDLHRRRRFTRVVSTGSGIAIGYLPYLAARGVDCHYIESAARVAGPSVTGRLLRHVPGIHTYTQHRSWSDKNWHYGGNGFDSYEPAAVTRTLSNPIRVVVTVGTATEFPFRRLLVQLSKLLAPGGGLEQATGSPVDVLWQTGGAPVDDLPISPTPFLPAADLMAALGRADIVVSHAGTGSALANLAAGRYAVMVPRIAEFGEAGDDHQRELAIELESRGLAVHRDASEMTVEDLLMTLSKEVRRAAQVSPFELRS